MTTRHNILLGALFSVMLLSFYNVKPVSGAPLVDSYSQLKPGTDWPALFTADTGYGVHTTYFGSYVSFALDDYLYIGLSGHLPHGSNGADILQFDGTDLESVGTLDDQGVIDMTTDGTNLFIAGPDAHEDWSLGNYYKYEGTTLSKYREGSGLTGFGHMQGTHYGEDGVLYATGVRYTTCVCDGVVSKSIDGGATWTDLLQVTNKGISDIEVRNGAIYALENGTPRIYKSTNDGVDWTTIDLPDVSGTFAPARMIQLNDTIFFDAGYASIPKMYRLSADDTVTVIDLPFNLGKDWGFAVSNRHLVAAGFEYIYALAGDGKIFRSTTGDSWEEVVDTGKALISISFWPNKNWLVVSESGTGGDIYYIDLAGTRQTQIQNVPSSLQVIDIDLNISAQLASAQLNRTGRNLRIRNTSNKPIADVSVNLADSRDWSTVSATSDRPAKKAVVSGLASAPGSSGNHTLYVPRDASDTSVIICPDATTLAGVTATCSNKSEKTEVDSDTSIVEIDGESYWKITGLIGTGGISVDAESEVSEESGDSVSNSSSSGSTAKKNSPARPDISKMDGGILKGGGTHSENGVTIFVQPFTANFDIDLKVLSEKKNNPFTFTHAGIVYWQVSDKMFVCIEDFYNRACVLPTLQTLPSVLNISFPPEQVSAGDISSIPISQLKIAHSVDGESWSVIESVVNVSDSNVATVTKPYGYYMLVKGVSEGAQYSRSDDSESGYSQVMAETSPEYEGRKRNSEDKEINQVNESASIENEAQPSESIVETEKRASMWVNLKKTIMNFFRL